MAALAMSLVVSVLAVFGAVLSVVVFYLVVVSVVML